jgi:hypothetical protein
MKRTTGTSLRFPSPRVYAQPHPYPQLPTATAPVYSGLATLAATTLPATPKKPPQSASESRRKALARPTLPTKPTLGEGKPAKSSLTTAWQHYLDFLSRAKRELTGQFPELDDGDNLHMDIVRKTTNGFMLTLKRDVMNLRYVVFLSDQGSSDLSAVYVEGGVGEGNRLRALAEMRRIMQNLEDPKKPRPCIIYLSGTI